jgi:hypothetical protein
VYYPEFALATAIALVGSAAQRSYTLPGGNLPGYHILVGPPGCGKNDYLSYSTAAIKDVDVRLLSPEARHAEAVKKLLSDYPSRIYIADEIGDDIAEGSSPQTRNVVARSLCKIWLEIWDPRPVLLGSMTKSKEGRIDNINHPRWSMLGAMTASDLDRIARIPEFANKGLYSRICMWQLPAPAFPGYRPQRGRTPVSPSVLGRLKGLHRHMELEGLIAEVGSERTWQEAPTRAVAWPTVQSPFGPQDEFSRRWEGVNRHLTLYGEGTEDLVSGIISRAKMKALTFSSIHALACERETLMRADVEFGWSLADVLLKADLQRLSLESEFDRQCAEVLRYLSGQRPDALARFSDVQTSSRRLKPLPRKDFEELLSSMAKDGLIVIERGQRKNQVFCRLPSSDDHGDAVAQEISDRTSDKPLFQ